MEGNDIGRELGAGLLESVYQVVGPGDMDQLLPEYENLLAQIGANRVALKTQFLRAPTRAEAQRR